jgi:Integrase zinc binding domain/Integrase core domain
MRKFNNPNHPPNISLPDSLVPMVLAYYHLMGHSGSKKLKIAIRKCFYWPQMNKSISEFTKGCILCSIFKHDTKGRLTIGEPIKLSEPGEGWQFDIVSGLVNVRNQHSYINFVDLFSGFCIPVPLKNEKSSNIASVIESVIIKCFGVPKFFSSDNASNLQGSEIVSVFKFYWIKHHKTTAYSPTSHSVVENSNRYLTQLLRIYGDQYSASWVDILTLAAVTVNSLPRICLSNKSPFFMFHGKEPLEWKDSTDLKFLSVSQMADETTNNRNFARLINEFLYRYRIKHNEKCRQKAISIPKNSLVYIKNYAPGIHRKLKPIYVKQPQLVVAEYPNVIYTKDFNNRISRHSKSNVKLAGENYLKIYRYGLNFY